MRSSGTIISASLSLGYDVHHARVEPLLIKAAEQSGLEGPFVQVLELGDHAITYRISGLLTEIKSMISSRSTLYVNIMDCLHEDNIEIVSPSFMNQRKLPDDLSVLPVKATARKKASAEGTPEDVIFDKAEEAQTKDRTVKDLLEQLAQLEIDIKAADGDKKVQKQAEFAALKETIDELQSQKIKSDET